MRPVITIDGLAGSGKSTLGRMLAESLGFAFFSTGLVYRTVGLMTLRSGIDPGDEAAVCAALDSHEIKLSRGEFGVVAVLLDGAAMGGELSSPEVSEATSLASQHAPVRSRLLTIQRECCPGEPLVAEGRDMGTVVFPDAPLKFFITAAVEVRRERRLGQMLDGKPVPGEDELRRLQRELDREITERDARDTGRAVAPTRPAPDALTIDNSSRPADAVVRGMAEEARRRGIGL